MFEKIKSIKFWNFKKYLLPVAIGVLVVGIGIAAYFGVNYLKYTRNMSSVQKTMLTNYRAKNSYSITMADAKTNTQALSGSLLPSGSFTGSSKVGDTTYSVIRVDNQNYAKTDKDANYQKDDNMFVYQLNILTHPEWIQIQKRLTDTKLDGKTYLQYEIIFENPDQEILKTLSEEQLNSLRIYGTILIDKETMLLKQISIHQGKGSTENIVINYSSNDTAPKIEAPSI